ncbi:MAG: hypothetical protein ACUVS2_17145 [Candidatus Flexifilum sp.]|jgi:hypothetical protein
MDQLLYSLYTIAFIVLSAMTARVWLASRSVGTLMLLFVMLAMIYENGVLALGVVIGHGPLLEALSWLRFIGYAAFPPLLVITGLDAARRSGVAWADRRAVRLAAWVVTAALIAFALFVEVIGRELEPRVLNGVVRYMWVSKGVPPLGVILMNLILIGFGFAIWRQTRYAGLLLGAGFLLIGDGIAAGRYVLGSGIELIFMAALLAVEVWVVQHRQQAQPVSAARQFAPGAAGD